MHPSLSHHKHTPRTLTIKPRLFNRQPTSGPPPARDHIQHHHYTGQHSSTAMPCRRPARPSTRLRHGRQRSAPKRRPSRQNATRCKPSSSSDPRTLPKCHAVHTQHPATHRPLAACSTRPGESCSPVARATAVRDPPAPAAARLRIIPLDMSKASDRVMMLDND